MFQPSQSLTFSNASAVLAQGLQALAQQQSVIDMAALTTVDSSAVAVLLAWQRAARERQLALRFRNLPANLRSLIALYGVEALLPGDTADTGAAADSVRQR
ncbi:lipid asymmetry maintenance protein MlaB [Herminiimonas sp. CN]|uniref:STAS domain-containing protein n=1 Tax=Herminiimonas sp. CN TaxID=1349818 RepID=UPI0004737E99|nr:STAS domain-containing protein [Herminiimonas sp. CN]